VILESPPEQARPLRRIATIAVWLLAALTLAACAGQRQTAKKPKAPPQSPGEQPPVDNRDWLRLRSGEWLAGEFLGYRSDQIRFDSDVLNEVELDWKKVTELHTRRVVNVLLTRRRTVSGKVSLRASKAVITGDNGGTFPRTELLAIVPAGKQHNTNWSGKLTWSLTAVSGNTSRFDSSAHAQLTRETAATRGEISYNGTFSATNQIRTSDQSQVDAGFDVFLSKRLFVTPLSIAYFRDPFQNIRSRFSPSVGLGYEFIDKDGFDWNANLGAGWQRTQFESFTAGSEGSFEETTGVIGTDLEVDITKEIEFEFDYEIQFALNNPSDYNHVMRATLSVELWDDAFELDIGLIWNRTSDPAADFGNGRYNDHHFQIGYMLYAAAVACRYDPQFCDVHRVAIGAIARDVAMPPDDALAHLFPVARCKDLYDGHSWASGLFQMADGKSQESSSEAVNAYYGAALVGEALGDEALRSWAQLLLAMEIRSAQWYWHVPSASPIYDPSFAATNRMVGVVGATDANAATWFGANLEYVHGINIMPVTPVTEALLPASYVAEQYAQLATRHGRMEAAWAGFAVAAHAIVDPAKALLEVAELNAFDNGNSRTNMLHWVATRPAPPTALLLALATVRSPSAVPRA